MLVGTTSVEGSERLSNRLRAEAVRRLLQILLIRNVWLEKNDRAKTGGSSRNSSRSTNRSSNSARRTCARWPRNWVSRSTLKTRPT